MSGIYRRAPRAGGPSDFLARWYPHGSCWFLAVMDRDWGIAGTAGSGVAAGQDHPADDSYLAAAGFEPLPGSRWRPDGTGGWVRDVRRPPQPHQVTGKLPYNFPWGHGGSPAAQSCGA